MICLNYFKNNILAFCKIKEALKTVRTMVRILYKIAGLTKWYQIDIEQAQYVVILDCEIAKLLLFLGTFIKKKDCVLYGLEQHLYQSSQGTRI